MGLDMCNMGNRPLLPTVWVSEFMPKNLPYVFGL